MVHAYTSVAPVLPTVIASGFSPLFPLFMDADVDRLRAAGHVVSLVSF
ncbi:MAG: hypothetical protein RLZZ324_872, partial [Candidatus Parcubacteria bacterium]